MNDREMIRSFLAVNPDKGIKEELYQCIRPFMKKAFSLKWVRMESLHITLKFCGEMEPRRVEDLQDLLGRTFRDRSLPPFRVCLDRVGAFPSMRRPRTFWIGVREGRENLVSLASIMDHICSKVSVPVERRGFHPHITIARVKDPSDIKSSVRIEMEKKDMGHLEWNVSEVQFIRSILTPAGPEYRTLNSYVLN